MGLNKQISFIPLFPLGGFPFPGEKMELFIFEPKYKQLLRECYISNDYFGLTFNFPDEPNGGFGVLVKVNEIIKENEDGTFYVEIEGVKPFKVKSFQEFFPGKLYSGGEVEFFDLKWETNNSTLFFWYQLFRGYNQEKREGIKKSKKLSLFEIARVLSLTYKEKALFLGLPTQSQKELFLMNKFKILQAIKKQAALVKNKFYLN
jgi:hypothetical protein